MTERSKASPVRRFEPAARLGLVVVDDHPAVRRGLVAMCLAEGNMRVLAAAASADEGFAAIKRVRPAVALLDLHLAKGDGLSLCLRTRSLPSPPRVVIFSAFADDALVLHATVAGADATLAKEASFDELSSAVRALARGERRLPSIPPRVLAEQAAKLDPDDRPILALLRARVPDLEIARTLDIAPAWLRARRWAILGRLRERMPRHGRRRGRADSPATSPTGPRAA